MTKKILLLGLGFWGKNWVDLLNRTDRTIIAGVAGCQSELDFVQEKYSLDPSILFTDYKEAIEKTDADIAVVVLPRTLHFDADKRAMEKGMSVITEKPLAFDFDEAQELLRIKQANPSVKFMTSQNYRWRPHNQLIRSSIENGLIGDVETILCEFRKQEDLQGYRAGLEYPLLEDVCIHHFDLLRFYTGLDCTSVYCECSRPSWSIFNGIPDTNAIIELGNKVKVTYNGSWAARGKESSWDGNFTITGSKGALTLDADDNVYFYEFTKDEAVVMESGAEKGVLLEKPEMKFREMEYALNMMLDCFENGSQPETTIEDNIKSFAIVDACLRSAKSGNKISLQ